MTNDIFVEYSCPTGVLNAYTSKIRKASPAARIVTCGMVVDVFVVTSPMFGLNCNEKYPSMLCAVASVSFGSISLIVTACRFETKKIIESH